MGRHSPLGLACAAFVLAASWPAIAADPPAGASAAAAPAASAPMVPPAKPGVFSAQKKAGTRYHLAVAGHSFTSRDAIEKYLLYRAAELTLQQQGSWFTLVESRTKGDTEPVPKPDPAGLRYSFRLAYWRPVWRYKESGATAWKSWSPFAGAPFAAVDPKKVSAFEVSADIVLHKGTMNDADPLAFEAGAVSDLLVNQVSPPE